MPKPKTKVIAVRVIEPRYRLLRDVAREMSRGSHQVTVSELLNSIIEYFFLSYTLGQWTKPLPELRKEFRDFLSSISKEKKK